MGLENRPRSAAASRAGRNSAAGRVGVRPRAPALRVGALDRRVRATDATLAGFRRLLSEFGETKSAVLVRSLLGIAPDLSVSTLVDALSLQDVLRPELVAARLDELLALEPRSTSRAKRRRHGSYYTPPALVQMLLDDALDPLLQPLETASASVARLRALRILDPACGSGAFLWAMAQRLEQACVMQGMSVPEARSLAVACIAGADVDALALAAARVRFTAAGWSAPLLVHGDALAGPRFGTSATESQSAALNVALDTSLRAAHSESASVVDWNSSFAAVAQRGGFDLIIGNPPFANAMEGGTRTLLPAIRAALYPELCASSDLSHAFLAQALHLVNATGHIAFVLPRSVLSAAGAAGVRSTAMKCLRPVKVRLPERCDLFSGADVHVCLLTLGHEAETQVEFASGTKQPFRCRGVVHSAQWWEELQRLRQPTVAVPSARTTTRLDEMFEVRATFFVQDFYALREHLEDAEHGTGPRFITTGLIEPGESLWGQVLCRYAKRDRLHPRLMLNAMPEALRRKVQRQLVPKILVAGLARRVEALLDREGELVGALQTFMLTPKVGGFAALEVLADWLNGGAAAELLRCKLGANALSGGNISLRPDFLRALPLPRSVVRGVRAQARISRATSPCTSVSRKSRPA